MQQEIAQTVTKIETWLHVINNLLVSQHQLVVSMIAGCKQRLDVKEVLLRQNAAGWSWLIRYVRIRRLAHSKNEKPMALSLKLHTH